MLLDTMFSQHCFGKINSTTLLRNQSKGRVFAGVGERRCKEVVDGMRGEATVLNTKSQNMDNIKND